MGSLSSELIIEEEGSVKGNKLVFKLTKLQPATFQIKMFKRGLNKNAYAYKSFILYKKLYIIHSGVGKVFTDRGKFQIYHLLIKYLQ